MNFLGHLFLSGDHHGLMTANLLGDFIKGKDYTHLSPLSQKGITLHRQIDHYIDHHPKVTELVHQLYSDLPKIAGIAVDLLFDHLLAKNWNQFSEDTLDHFVQSYYRSIDYTNPDYPPFFQFVLKKMTERNWLLSYASLAGIQQACNGVSGRISFENNLNEAPRYFQQYEEEFESTFFLYMKDAIPHFTQVRKELEPFL